MPSAAASALAPSDRPAILGDVVIIGGGCYGTFYAGQLESARRKGKAAYHRLLVVDRDPACRVTRELEPDADRQLVALDWAAFLDQYLSTWSADRWDGPDVIVPSPLMPHLMYEWLLRRARARWPARLVETRQVPEGPGTPYDRVGRDGTRYLSFADWLCPTHCIEPAICPVTRAPRTWEMSEALTRLTASLDRKRPTAGPALFICRHEVFGVGTFSVGSVVAGDALVIRAGAAGSGVDVIVGTVSSCHGAVSLLYLGPL